MNMLTRLLTVVIVGLTGPSFASQSEARTSMYPSKEEAAIATARQDIEYLRRQYGHATDLIGKNTPEAIAEGLAIYHRIFTPEAKISAGAAGQEPLRAEGPEGWADVVAEALSKFRATQHMIGSQLVTIDSLPAEGDPASGRARMASHLHAWHDGHDGVLDIFIGTYHDEVRYVPGTGWQIETMHLERVSGEIRPPQD